MTNAPKPIPIHSPRSHAAFAWAAHQRRPAFLLLLLTGLVLFMVWLPAGARTALWLALRAQRGLFLLLFCFALITVSLIWSAGQRMDARVFTLLNMRVYPKWLDRGMWVVTQLGNMLTALGIAVLFFILDDRPLAVLVIMGTVTLWLLVELIKAIADRDRPFLALDNTRVIGSREKGESFPSGHTAQIFFLSTLFIQYFQPGLAGSIGLYAIALLVGFTRIYMGAHYPRDVFAGMVLGSVWGILASLSNAYWFGLHT